MSSADVFCDPTFDPHTCCSNGFFFCCWCFLAGHFPGFAFLSRDGYRHVVGDNKGCNANFNYSEWAKDKIFVVGRKLVFNYNNTKHNVFKVNGTEFQDCAIPDANQGLSSGHHVIPLATPGNKWYVCGFPNHCRDLGMKLALNAMPSSSASLLFVAAMLATATSFVGRYPSHFNESHLLHPFIFQQNNTSATVRFSFLLFSVCVCSFLFSSIVPLGCSYYLTVG
ncbi:blue copper protein 1a-like [Prosopis cineraria]|uniref:blue copper protein 1a-like n=1 Tax=Prosopis cineraria TaxID=364024 RepID=UPI00240FE392|nr:blue copper protein 1a-like [Prosopis cineraria]